MKYILLLFLTTVSFAQELEEFRGVKITDVDSKVLYTDNNIADAMDYLASININAILVVVLNGGYTQYPSAIMDSLFNGKSIDPDFKDRDPLERIIIEAHRNGIEVYPWFEYGFASFYSGGTAPFGGHILDKYPDWALRTSDGNICTKNGFDWMSVVNPDVQNFINGLVKEVITNYDVDGVEFSDRIPALPVEGGYDSVTVAIYKDEHNGLEPPTNFCDANWKRWRADKLNQWYHDVRKIVKNHDENLFVASSPSQYPWAYHNYLQDAQTWIDEGIADHYIPQLYRYNYNDYIYELNQSLIHSVGKRETLFPGFLLNIGTGSNAYLMSVDYLLDALKVHRDNDINGEVYFFYEGFRKNNNQIGDTLKATYYKEPAKIPLRDGNIRRPKAKIVNENDADINSFGDWVDYAMPGFEGKIKRVSYSSDYNYMEYNFEISNAAYYDLYTFMVPNTNLTEKGIYKVYAENDSLEFEINQGNMKRKGWQKLTSIYLKEGKQKVLRIDNSKLEEGKYLAADAAMLMINRKLSPDTYVTSTMDEIQVDKQLPVSFELKQNYPNPFNPATTIEFSIPAKSNNISSDNIKLTVYDVLGNKIKTLVNEKLSSGNHIVKFDASDLSSGIYFYTMNFNGNSISRKMILLK